MALSKQNRLKNREDFNQVFRRGRSVGGSFLFLKVRKSLGGESRFGFIVPSRAAKKAVDRNKIKRIAADTIRSVFFKIKHPVDVVLVFNKNQPLLSGPIKKDILTVLKRAEIIK